MATDIIKKGAKIDKREAIIEAARALFTTEGYETTTIAEVARKAGVAVGTVYLYFKTKPEILEAVQNSWEHEFVGAMQELDLQGIPHHLRARPIIEGCFAMCARDTDMVQIMGVLPQSIGVPHKHFPSPIREALVIFLSDGIAAGSFREMDIEAAATIAFGMVESTLHQCFYVEDGTNQQRYIETLVDAMQRWIGRPEVIRELYPQG